MDKDKYNTPDNILSTKHVVLSFAFLLLWPATLTLHAQYNSKVWNPD